MFLTLFSEQVLNLDFHGRPLKQKILCMLKCATSPRRHFRTLVGASLRTWSYRKSTLDTMECGDCAGEQLYYEAIKEASQPSAITPLPSLLPLPFLHLTHTQCTTSLRHVSDESAHEHLPNWTWYCLEPIHKVDLHQHCWICSRHVSGMFMAYVVCNHG